MKSRRENKSANDGDVAASGSLGHVTLPEGFPAEWRALEFRASPGLILTEYNCVDGQFFKDYAVSSLEAAVAKIAHDGGNCVFYQFYVPEVVPAFAWDADWPLLRRGQNPPCERRKRQGPEPWVWKADPTYFEIGRVPLTFFTGRPYLRVGGRTSEEAVHNWNACARVIRAIYRACGSGR